MATVGTFSGDRHTNTSVYNIGRYQIKAFGTCQFGKIGDLVNFIIQKLKSKHLFCLSFLWWHVRGIERKYLTHIPGLNVKINSEWIDFIFNKSLMHEKKYENGSEISVGFDFL